MKKLNFTSAIHELTKEELKQINGGTNWWAAAGTVLAFAASPGLGFLHLGVKEGIRLASQESK